MHSELSYYYLWIFTDPQVNGSDEVTFNIPKLNM